MAPEAEETVEETFTEEVAVAPSDSADPAAALKSALDKERKRAERAEQELRATKFLKDHPHLTDEDLKGVKPDRWDYLADRLKPPAAPAVEEPKAPAVPEEERKEIERFTQKAGGSGPAAQGGKIPFREAEKMPWDERRKLIEQGAVEGFAPGGKWVGLT